MRLSFTVELPPSSSLFTGHFPGRPILPGIAHLAMAERALRELTSQEVAITAVQVLKLRRPVSPGEALELRIDFPDTAGVSRFEVLANGEAASQGTIRTGGSRSLPEMEGDFGAADLPAAGFPSPESLLPHAPPALLLRAVAEVADGAVVAVAEVSPGHPLVKDDRLPTFLALEAAAQAAAALEALGRRETPGPRIGYLVGIRDARFAVPSLPAGHPLRVAARFEGGAFPLSRYAVAVGGTGREVATGILSTFLRDDALIRDE